ncbi:hypothetical protein [Oceanisphaera avium]|uniref:MSHA biogenesis protein MshJ n=1 Tax=Oceanisphaera avium TaxID=1903694 RepID=A0A1Y0CVH5_9GAMM|nr:hypothetical protein [Oceanisphaera avium]ART79239.1 hypothetical protein CBP12_03000 [Oceanisphaera avium]
MTSLNPTLAKGQQWFIALSQRERWLVLAAGWALLVWFGLLLYDATLGAKVEAQQAHQQQLNSQLNEQAQLRAELNEGLLQAKNDSQHAKLAQLNQQLQELNAHVDDKMRTLVEPEQMSSLLLSMLEQNQGLELLELSNEAPVLLTAEEESEHLYQHNLSLVLSGSYLSLLEYVARLEKLSGRIFWRGLEFELETHPNATIRLDFFTISQHRELLRG